MKYKKYPSYKDSDVEWLGYTPSNWEVERLSHYFVERREKVSDVDFEPLSVTKNGIVPQLENAAKTDAGDNRKKVCSGDFVINSRSDRKGSSGLSKLTGSVSLISTVLKPTNIESKYSHHLLKSYPFQEEFYRYGKGIVADLWSTNYSEMKNIIIPSPPKDEQQQIANFLDNATLKIDTLIEKQTKLIELLKEKRQAVISHAVTKGLDPNVPMKDSGVEWLGEIPEHWEVKKLKYCMSKMKAGPFGSSLTKDKYTNSGYRVYGQEQVIPNNFTIGDYYISENYFKEMRQYEVVTGDILISCVGTYGKIALFPENSEAGIINPRLILMRTSKYFLPEYIEWFLKSDFILNQMSINTRGGTMDIVNISILSELSVCFCNIQEQQKIVSYINEKTSKIDTLIEKSNKATELLKEKRAALISSAVTGKIDVRDTA